MQLANKVPLAVGSSCPAPAARARTAKQQSSHQQPFENLQCPGGKAQRSLYLSSVFCPLHSSLSQLERQSLCFGLQLMKDWFHFSLGTNLQSGQNSWATPRYRGPQLLCHLHSLITHSSPCSCPTALFLPST